MSFSGLGLHTSLTKGTSVDASLNANELQNPHSEPAQFLVTPRLELIGANLTADEILRRGDSVTTEDGVVKVIKADLREPVADLVSSASHKGYRALVTCTGEAGEVTWAASSRMLLGSAGGPQSILVTLRPLVKSEPIAGAELVSLFNLTPAEARLSVELAAGHSLADISARRGVHISTLRAQLRSVFAKTGMSKQSEFVSAIWRAAAV